MTATFALMRAEMVLLRRNTTAWSTAVAIPFVLGALWAMGDPPVGQGMAAVVVFQVMVLLVFTLHTVGTMTLASRREQLVLKRWRSSQAGATGVLVGTIGVLVALVAAQAAVLIAIVVNIGGEAPTSVPMLTLGVFAGVATIGALTFVVAGFTQTPEHATITTFPVVVGVAGSAIWALTRPFDAFDWPVLALPGGAATQLLRLGWDGPARAGDGTAAWLAEAAPSLGATVVLTAVAAAAAVRWFRWEPRA